VNSLKVLDPNRPIREADIRRVARHVRDVPQAEVSFMAFVLPSKVGSIHYINF
jgi:hypothetical protein